MLWLEPNGEVHCKLYYSANVMKEGIFQNGGKAGWPINTLCLELVKLVFGRRIQKVGDMY